MAQLTDLGFEISTLPTILAELEAAMKAEFPGQLVGPDSNTGRLIAIFAERLALEEQLAQAVHGSSDPDQASGVSLDHILAMSNLLRIEADKTTVWLRLDGTDTTAIAALSLAGHVTSREVFENIVAGTISRLKAIRATYRVANGPHAATVTFTITMGTATFVITVDAGGSFNPAAPANNSEVASGMVDLINDGFTVTAEVTGSRTISVDADHRDLFPAGASVLIDGSTTRVVESSAFVAGDTVVTLTVASAGGSSQIRSALTAALPALADLTPDETGTAQAGAGSTITLATTSSGTDDVHNGSQIKLIAGLGAGQTRKISDYTGATRIAAVSVAWTTNPDVTTQYEIYDVIDIIVSMGIPANLTTLSDIELVAALGASSVGGGLTLTEVGSPLLFTARSAGATEADVSTVTRIETPISNWNAVTNPIAADVGNAIETDAAARIRRAESVRRSNSTDRIRAALLAVSQVDRASVAHNATDAVDADGLLAHSILAVVTGGLDLDIAQAIFANNCGGINTNGVVLINITDAQGVLQPIRFSRPVGILIHWEITVNATYGEEALPVGASDTIKSAIAKATDELNPGVDVIPQRQFSTVFSAVTGIQDITVQVAKDDGSGSPGGVDGSGAGFQGNPVAILPAEFADGDVSRVTVIFV